MVTVKRFHRNANNFFSVEEDQAVRSVAQDTIVILLLMILTLSVLLTNVALQLHKFQNFNFSK